MSTDTYTDFSITADEHFRAGYQCLGIVTSEEARVEIEIARVGKGLGLGVVTWDSYEGFSAPESLKNQAKYRHPHEALKAIADSSIFSGDQLFIFRDLDDYLNDPVVRRTLRTLVGQNKLVNKRFKRPLILLSPTGKWHEKVKSCITPLEFELPDEERLRQVFKFVKISIESSDSEKASCSPELEERVIQCLLGLTATEAENALARCLVRHGGFSEDMLQTIKDEKATIIGTGGVLTYIPEGDMATRDEIGGFENLLTFIDRRALAYGKAARTEHMDFPKGVVLLGIPGTGKSYVASAVARLLGLPGYIMDVGSVFGSLVGESEQRMRDALKTIKAQRGCVLLLDEADKAFGGAADSSGDSGVTKRVFGQLLTWLSSKQDRTFVIMTLNRTKGIPEEFLRAGRFDKVFYTDLPFEAERRAILEIHMRKRHVDPETLGLGDAEWLELMDKTKKFVGSELEEMVREARYISFEARGSGKPNFAELTQAAGGLVPLATLNEESVNAIRTYCQNRATPVSPPPERTDETRTRAVAVE